MAGGDYVVAIPSYKRAELLKDKTLAMLQAGGVAPQRIHIFVANKAEGTEYARVIPKELYGKIVVGKPGITPQRRFIVKYFPEGTHIVSIDDDVAGMYERLSAAKLGPLANVDAFFRRAFKETEASGLYIWGIYPVLNAFYMKPGSSTNLKFILGTLYGFINRRSADLRPTLGEKEDYELSILHFLKDGGVMRFNDIGIKTKFHNPNGGLGDIKDRFAVNEAAAASLKAKYPKYGYVWHRKNGMAEFRLQGQGQGPGPVPRPLRGAAPLES